MITMTKCVLSTRERERERGRETFPELIKVIFHEGELGKIFYYLLLIVISTGKSKTWKQETDADDSVSSV